MNFLITGGTGFLGSRLLKRLLRDGHGVVLLKRASSDTHRIREVLPQVSSYDVDQADLRSVFQAHAVDCVLHCATNYGRKPHSAIDVIEPNLVLPLRLLELAVEHKAAAFINTDTILDKGVNSYSLSKKQFIDWMQVESRDMRCVSVALEHFYGPGDDSSKFVSHIVRSLIREVPYIDLTEGTQTRDFIFIDDVVDAFAAIIGGLPASSGGFSRFEVGAGQKTSVRSFVELAKSLSGNTKTELRFGALPLRKNEVMHPQLNLRPLLELGWSPKFSVEDGLAETVKLERLLSYLSSRMG